MSEWITELQRLTWRICKIKPADVLRMSLSGVELVISAGLDEWEESIERANIYHADMIATVLNANGKFKNKKWWKYTDFMPNDKNKKKITDPVERQKILSQAYGQWVEDGEAAVKRNKR